jgi:hypothetical protein
MCNGRPSAEFWAGDIGTEAYAQGARLIFGQRLCHIGACVLATLPGHIEISYGFSRAKFTSNSLNDTHLGSQFSLG